MDDSQSALPPLDNSNALFYAVIKEFSEARHVYFAAKPPKHDPIGDEISDMFNEASDPPCYKSLRADERVYHQTDIRNNFQRHYRQHKI